MTEARSDINKIDARLDELKKTSATLKTHWDETRSLWNDKLRNKADKEIEYFLSTIKLCLYGFAGQEHAYGRGMYDFFEFIDKTAKTFSKYSGLPFDIASKRKTAKTERFTEDTKHKRKYSDKKENDVITDYDIYPREKNDL